MKNLLGMMLFMIFFHLLHFIQAIIKKPFIL